MSTEEKLIINTCIAQLVTISEKLTRVQVTTNNKMLENQIGKHAATIERTADEINGLLKVLKH